MSVHVSQSSDAIVVSARSHVEEDCFLQVVSVLGNLAEMGRRIVLDLSEVAIAPTSRVTAFMEHLAEVRKASGSSIVVVVERSTGRRLLRTVGPQTAVPVVASIAAALQQERS